MQPPELTVPVESISAALNAGRERIATVDMRAAADGARQAALAAVRREPGRQRSRTRWAIVGAFLLALTIVGIFSTTSAVRKLSLGDDDGLAVPEADSESTATNA